MKHNINIAKRLDIVVKYLFIKAYIENIKYDFYKNLYKKHIKLQSGGIEDNKKNINDFEREFINLIESIKNNWFNKDFPIIKNTQWDILNWAHRFACSLYFEAEAEFIINNNIEWIDWSYNWFQDNNFTQDELLAILWWYTNIAPRYAIAIVWPNIKNLDLNILWRSVGDLQIKIKNKQNYKELIYDIYSHDFGAQIHLWAIEKANYLANIWTHIHLYLLDRTPENLYKDKESIRASLVKASGISDASKAPYYTIHSWDTIQETKYLRDIILNPDNIAQIQQRNFSERRVFLKRLSTIEQYLQDTNISRNDICLVGSTSMEIFHLDTTSDIDFIMAEHKGTGIVRITDDIDYLDYKYSKMHKNIEIIHNPSYHFFFRGFKFINLELLADIKRIWTREKDIKQAKTIDNFLKNNRKIEKSFLAHLYIEIKYFRQRFVIKILKLAIYITKKLHIYRVVSYLWRRFILKRNWK